MHRSTLKCIIPAPLAVEETGGKLDVSALKKIGSTPKSAAAAELLRCGMKQLNLPLENGSPAQIVFADRDFPEAAWEIEVGLRSITVTAGSASGFRYAAEALLQMVTLSMSSGPDNARLDTGILRDEPRFGWRGFMLDSVRHFQSAKSIVKVLKLLAAFRINVFHWHLTDSEAWRLPKDIFPELAGSDAGSEEFYTLSDLAMIRAEAAALGIRIVPEIDLPGHSHRLLDKHPELRCFEKRPSGEICLGSPESLKFARSVCDQLIELFPESKIIHIGGDEADDEHWKECPRCRAAAEAKSCRTMRALEQSFMAEVNRHIAASGRTPMMWSTPSPEHLYPEDTIMQSWLDIREPLKYAANGNKVVYSVHNSLYFDYPANQYEPQASWMFELDQRGVYMTDPYIIWPEKVKNSILGTEAALWTEVVPEWRVLTKILPRLPAYSECAWSAAEHKDFDDFLRRRNTLETAGWFELLRERIG